MACSTNFYQTPGLKRVTLRDLEPNTQEILIVGVIIAKQQPKTFLNMPEDDGDCKAVLNFTFRDSFRDFINVSLWGKSQHVSTISERFSVGDTVEIIRPRVLIRKFDDTGEQFRPRVTSPFALGLNEQSDIVPHDGDITDYQKLLHFPAKPLTGFTSLRDIHNQGDSFQDQRTVDVLGAVRNVGTTRAITTRRGEEMNLREVVLFDHTDRALKLTLWNADTITRAGMWKARSTIIFITDAKVQWSDFMKTYSISETSRSIVTENPVGAEARALAGYAKDAVLNTTDIVNEMVTNIPDPDSIQNVMCVHQVCQRLNTILEQRDGFIMGLQFTALMFVTVSQLDLDGFGRTVSVKCGNCKNFLKDQNAMCKNTECPNGTGSMTIPPEVSFDIKVDLSDHTGTLRNCKLSGTTAEQVLNCTVQEFMRMNDDEKCRLKWKYLLQRCAVRIMVMFFDRRRPNVSIVSCSIADPAECVKKIPVY